MSSGLPYKHGEGRDFVYSQELSEQVLSQARNLGLTARQRKLDWLYRWFSCAQYDGRSVDFDGYEYSPPEESELTTVGTFIPPGFYDASQMPFKYRRPTTPYHLARVIIKRFTELLFSSRRVPKLHVEGDALTEDYLAALLDACKFWPRMALARNLGGAMGCVAIGFQFYEGKPVVEIHDPRWVYPVFEDRVDYTLKAIEKRWMYPIEERVEGPRGREWKTVWYWYRRIIDEEKDLSFIPVPVADGTDPIWEIDPARSVEHNLGFCPVVWLQNVAVLDDPDGEPDCLGCYDQIGQIDQLLSMAARGVVQNCFSVDTSFVTDKGLRRFSELREGDVVRVLSHKGLWQNAIVKCFGEQPLFEIVFQRGAKGAPYVVRATRDHRWILADGEETSQLDVGDRVISAPAHFSTFEYECATKDEKRFWCLGFIWGDGSKRPPRGVQVRLCGKKSLYAPRFGECGFILTQPAYLNGDTHAAHAFYTKELPSPESTPLNLLRAFVRGYVDADGSKSIKKKSTRWHRIQVTGEASVDFVRRVFPSVGLYIAGEVDMTQNVTNYGPRTEKTVRFSLNENASVCSNSFWRVVSITPLETAPVWCLSVDEDHSFTLPCGIVTRNCDPTVIVKEDRPLAEIRKGSDNTVKLTKGGDFSYAEITGTGPKAAREYAQELREYVLEVAQVVLPPTDGGAVAQTLGQIERQMSSMFAQADLLRVQYGDGILRLTHLILKAIRQLQQGAPDETGRIIRQEVKLPVKVTTDPAGKITVEKRRLGGGGNVRLVWPGYADPSLDDIEKASRAVVSVKDGGVIDQKHASEFIAPFYNIRDVNGMIKNIEKEAKAAAEAASGGMPVLPEEEE